MPSPAFRGINGHTIPWKRQHETGKLGTVMMLVVDLTRKQELHNERSENVLHADKSHLLQPPSLCIDR